MKSVSGKSLWIRLAIAAFLIIGGWGNREARPAAAVISIIIGMIVLLWPLVVLIVSKKLEQNSATSTAENDADAHAKGKRTADDRGTDQLTQRPQMPPVTIRINSSHDEDSEEKGGLYQYSYSGVGIYRPQNVDLDMPPIGAHISFEEDPENPYDDKAIKALYNGETIGWLYRKGKREMIRDWINNGWYYVAEITSAADDELKFWIGMNRN